MSNVDALGTLIRWTRKHKDHVTLKKEKWKNIVGLNNSNR